MGERERDPGMVVSGQSEHKCLSIKFTILDEHCLWYPKPITIVTSKISDHR